MVLVTINYIIENIQMISEKLMELMIGVLEYFAGGFLKYFTTKTFLFYCFSFEIVFSILEITSTLTESLF